MSAGAGEVGAPTVLAALRLEVLALRRACPDAMVIRLGLGPARAGARAARGAQWLAGQSEAMRRRPLLVAGLAGALGPGLAVGDVVVATTVLTGDGTPVAAPAPAAPLVAALAQLPGVRVREGTVVTVDHVAHGAERAALAALGADVVDMESAAVLSAPWPHPPAVLRVVSDTPEQELLSPAGVRGGLRALQALGGLGPALAQWAAGRRPAADSLVNEMEVR